MTRQLFRLAAMLAVAASAAGCSDAPASDLRASPENLKRVFADAGAGDTILLEAGNYGTFDGGMKPGEVTLKPQPGATAAIDALFSPASNITLDGVNLTYAVIADKRTNNITVRNSDVTGLVVLRTSELQDANILFDHNVHRDWDACANCPEGRIQLSGYTSTPTGVTIQNSEFRGGYSDGIQDTSTGTRILNNSFHDIPLPGEKGRHVDALQLLGASRTVIRGNFFARVPTGIMAPDGVDHLLIEDNVFAGTLDGYPYAISLGSDNGSIIRHNTLADGACGFNLRCGTISLGSKPGNPAGRGTVIKDNIVALIGIAGPATTAEQSNNLVRQPDGDGKNEIKGIPTYSGGTSPTSYSGYALAKGSLGKRNASDGLDRGARIGDVVPPPARPTRTLSGASAISKLHGAKLQVSRLWVDTRRRRLRLVASMTRRASGAVTVDWRAAGRTSRFDAAVRKGGIVRLSGRISRRQARLGTGIVTIRYGGDADTRPQIVRLRAAPRP